MVVAVLYILRFRIYLRVLEEESDCCLSGEKIRYDVFEKEIIIATKM